MEKKIYSIDQRINRALSRRDIIPENELDKIQIIECGEPMVKIPTENGKAVVQMSDERKKFEISEGRTDNVMYVRETVAKMLRQVEDALPNGYQLLIFDAFRPVEYQAKRFNERLEKFRTEFTDKTEEEIRAITFKYIFPPNMDPQKPSPHSTGGVLDLTLSYNGEPIDMGTGYGNYDKDRELIPTNSEQVTKEQRENRRFLVRLMLEAGFANYPGEWWHYMYGDREWVAYEKISKFAIYGRASIGIVIR